jgi:hypothetical protein
VLFFALVAVVLVAVFRVVAISVAPVCVASR